MDLLGVPHDLFELYIPSSIVTGKFDSMVTVMSLLALALLGRPARRLLVWDAPRRCVRGVADRARHGGHGGWREAGLAHAIDTVYRKDEALSRCSCPPRCASVVLARCWPRRPVAEAASHARAHSRARQRCGSAFVGDPVPFAFVNARGDLVGMDVELAAAAGARPGRGPARIRARELAEREPGAARRPHRRDAGVP